MKCDDKDLIRPIGDLSDGSTLVSRHRPDHSTCLATVRRAKDGESLRSDEEVISTRARPDGSREITDSYAPARSKPAQVATVGYRSGWDRTFNAPGGVA
jgi:hypothetical protein